MGARKGLPKRQFIWYGVTMKTKDLIKMLQAADPEGKMVCCIGNEPIDAVYPSPAYYDGRLEVLEKDDDGNIIGARWESAGFKVVFHTENIEDAIYGDPDLPVTYEGMCQNTADRYKDGIEKMRNESRQLAKEMEEWK